MTFRVPKMLGNGQRSQRHAQARPRGFIHLTEHQRRSIDDTGIYHFAIELCAFPCPFTHSGKDRVTTVFVGDITDKLHDKNRLSHSGSAEQADFTATGIRC